MTCNVFITNVYFYNSRNTYIEKYLIRNPHAVDTELKYIKSLKSDDVESISDAESDRETGRKNEFALKSKKSPGRRVFIATIFGRLKNRDDIAINVIKYSCNFAIEIPDGVNVDLFKRKFKSYINNYSSFYQKKHIKMSNIRNLKIIYKNTYMGWTNFEKKPYLYIEFKNSNTRMAFKYILKSLTWKHNRVYHEYKCKNPFKIKKFKDDYTHQFFQDININSSGWNSFTNWKNVDSDSKRTRCKYEIVTIYSSDNIRRLIDIDKYPIVTMAVDFECCPMRSYDAQVNELFKKPEYQHLKTKNYLELYDILTIHPLKNGRDPITQMGISIKYGSPYDPVDSKNIINICLSMDYHPTYNNSILNYMHQYMVHRLNSKLRKHQKVPNILSKFIKFGQCYDITDETFEVGKTYVVLYDDEMRMHLEFFELIKCIRPDIITTYNGHNFDWNFQKHVSKIMNQYPQFMMSGKMINTKGSWKQPGAYGKKKLFITNSFPGLIGITFVDIMIFYRELNNKKIKDLKLSSVAKYILGITKLDLPYREMYKKIHIGGIQNSIDVSRYCLRDCTLLHRLDVASMITAKLITDSQIGDLSINYMAHASSTKESVAALSKYAAINNTLLPTGSYDPSKLENAYNFEIENNPQLISEIKTIIDSTNIESYRDTRLEKHKLDWIKGFSHMGGHVEKAKASIIEHVVVFDYTGFYPSINRVRNISPDRIVLDPKYMNIPNIPYQTYNWTRINGTVETATVVHDINNVNKYKGIIPMAHEYYTTERNKVKREMKLLISNRPPGTTPEDIKKTIKYRALDIKQLSYKIKDNSCYGVTGQVWHPSYCRAAAGLTTQGARDLIMLAKKKSIEWYKCDVVYGDTDSIFVKFPLDENMSREEKFNESYRLGHEFVKKFNNYLCEIKIQTKENQIMRLGYEKQFLVLILTDVKKRYSGIKCCGKNINDVSVSVMGHNFIKRDSSIICNKVGIKVNEFALHGKLRKIPKFIRCVIRDIYNGKYEDNLFIEGQKYNPPYKNPHNIKCSRAVTLINKYKPELTPAPNDRVWITFKKLHIRRSIIKKCDQVWPLILLEDKELSKNIQIDFYVFIMQIMRHNMHIFKIVFNCDKHGVENFFKNEIEKYDKSI